MEQSLFRYIWTYTRRDQMWIVFIVALSMIPYYMSFDLPKQIVNGPISGIGFEQAGATVPFMRFEYDLPFVGNVVLSPGLELERLPLLVALSLAFLALVVVNGLFKVYINTYKGRLGERLLRRIRFDLVDRILRFPPNRFKSVKAGEISTMVKDEVEPMGGFTSDAFVQPAFLGGQALTALIFIFVQHVWLGLLALIMALIQVLVIPRLRQRLIVLGRERQLTARQLAGRVAEIVDGIEMIHATDTTNLVRADIATRLGRIFKIRYDIYQWKFFVKFLNNFIAQVTPFLFYLIGGYFTITGRLDVGQLVAVINAYKELPGPMKELIDWDLARQDTQVKYEQVIEQFDADVMIDASLQEVDKDAELGDDKPLEIRALTLADDTGTPLLNSTTLHFDMSETVAFVGSAGSGSDVLADAIGRVIWPSSGQIQLGEQDILRLPEAVTGRRISYSSSEGYYFSGTLEENLLFPLKNAPRVAKIYEGDDASFRNWYIDEAERSGNPLLDPEDEWIDVETLLQHTGAETLRQAVFRVLDIVELTDDIVEFALRTRLDPDKDSELAKRLVDVRVEFRDELDARNRGRVVSPFQPGAYNIEASVGENLLFGQVKGGPETLRQIVISDYFRNTLRDSGLGEMMYRAGHEIGEMAVSLMQDLPPDHVFFERMKLFPMDELSNVQRLLQRAGPNDFEKATRDDRSELMRLTAVYNESWYRFGALREVMAKKVVEVREQMQREMPDDIRELIDFYEPDQYVYAADVRENILFGKVNSRQSNAEAIIQEVGETVVTRHDDIAEAFLGLGLSYDVGSGGRRLTAVQRRKLNMARALLRRSDYYVFNRTLLGLDNDAISRIMRGALEFLREREKPPLVIWVLSNNVHASDFDRVICFDAGSVVEDSPRDEYLLRAEAS